MTVALKNSFNSPPSLKQIEHFIEAAKEGRTDSIKRFLVKFPHSINEKDDFSRTALMIATDPKTVKLLLDHGAYVDLKDDLGMTELRQAASVGLTEKVRLLLEHGADINAGDTQSITPLGAALRHRHFDILTMLLEQGADVNKSVDGEPLIVYAVTFKDTTAPLEAFLAHGAYVNAGSITEGTALIKAVTHENIAAVRLLIAKGADPFIADKSGHTALMYAEKPGRSEIRLLVEAHARSYHATLQRPMDVPQKLKPLKRLS